MKSVTFLFFLMMVQAHCEIPRPTDCRALADAIELSYETNTPPELRMRMLMRYAELDCEDFAPLGGK